MRSGTVVSSPNRGPRAPEHTFSWISGSPPQKVCSRGRRRFRILQHLPHVTPKLYPLPAPRLSQLRKRAAGSEAFLVSCIWRLATMDHSLRRRRALSLSPHSTDSHPLSNLSVWLFQLLHFREFSTSFIHSHSLKTWMWPTWFLFSVYRSTATMVPMVCRPSLVPRRLEAASEIATSAIGGLVADSAS
jgi:hypothetical protein